MNFTDLFNAINPKEVLTNLPDAVIVLDGNGKITWVNDKAAVIFETEKTRLKELYFNEIVANGTELAKSSYTKRNAVVTGAFTLDGKEFYIEMNAKKYIDDYFITIRDITAMTNVLVKAEQTGRLNKEKNRMLVKLANEIKSPLQSAIGFSQALIDGLGGEINEKQSKYIKIINKNSAELLYFMDKLLEFSQAESSLFNVDNEPFDLINLVQNVIKQNDKEISAKNLNLNLDYEEFNKRAIYSDEICLKTALQNVLDVAIKSTESGDITVKIDSPDLETVGEYNAAFLQDANDTSYVRITINDSGMGFASSELDGIFEPYTQLDKVHKKTIIRSLTLGTAHLIIKRLGGMLDLSSEVMKGSTFTIILPVEKDI